MYKTGILIYNGNAGKREVEKTLSQIIGLLSAAIPKLTLLKTQKKGDAERFCRQHGEEVEVVMVLGGDGTVHECVNGLAPLDRRPILSILPAGTCNDFARSLQIPLNPKQAVESILTNGQEKPIDIIQSNKRYFSNFWGTGLIAEASQNIDEQSKDLFGRLSYYISALKTLSEKDQFSFSLQIDGKTLEEKAVMVLVLNGKYIGATEFPLPSIKLNDGLMDILLIKESGFPLLKEYLTAKTTVNWDGSNPNIEHFQASSITITTPTSRVLDLDGEHYEGEKHKISVLKEHMKVLVNRDDSI